MANLIETPTSSGLTLPAAKVLEVARRRRNQLTDERLVQTLSLQESFYYEWRHSGFIYWLTLRPRPEPEHRPWATPMERWFKLLSLEAQLALSVPVSPEEQRCSKIMELCCIAKENKERRIFLCESDVTLLFNP